MYQFKLTNTSESEVWDIPFQSISITESLNKGVDGSLTVSFVDLARYAAALGTTPDGIIAAAARYWMLYRNGEMLYRGILLHRRVSGGNAGATTVNLNFADISAALAKRRTAAEVLFTADDSADIAWSLINTTQTDASGYGDLSITRGTHPTTIDRDRTLRFDNVRDTIVGMSNEKVANGYDFDFDSSNNFNIYYPKKGSTKLYVVFDDFNVISWSSDRPLQGKLTNRAIVLGKGQAGVDMVTTTREDTTPMATWGLCEDVVSEKGVEVVAELEDRGDQFLADNKTPSDTIALTVRDTAPDLSTYGIGDTVRVRLQDIDFDQNLRIKQRGLSIREGGDTTVTLTME